jgi:benzodiazapine receptor
MTQWLALGAWLLLCYLAASLGAIASIDAADFYLSLQRPAWAPPASVFGPVWTVLYGMMAVAAWLVWRRQSSWRQTALALFVVQLVLNALWSWLFFKWQLGAVASMEVVLLWLAIVATVIAFFRVNKAAGALMLPYLAWVSFATLLTITVWRLNPSVL